MPSDVVVNFAANFTHVRLSTAVTIDIETATKLMISPAVMAPLAIVWKVRLCENL